MSIYICRKNYVLIFKFICYDIIIHLIILITRHKFLEINNINTLTYELVNSFAVAYH
jgi:hypothetical protein